MNETEERVAFEAWVTASGRGHQLATHKYHGWYEDLTVTAWWTAWCARAQFEADRKLGKV